ncbi:MAG TPA: hypothetical protein VG843_06910 [Rhizomicrobium sp.]|nr:hypothetical protein [Rhizomicrobium sp.]
MKRMCGAAAIGALIAIASVPAPAQTYSGDTNYGSPHEMPTDDVPRPVSRDSASIAEDLRVKGKCDQAVPILRRVIDGGGDVKISEFDLGLCLYDLAAATSDAKAASDMRAEAAKWVLRSANAGFARAEEKAVSVMLNGEGVAADPVEAQKWALIYRRNPMRYVIGLPDLSAEVSGKLDAALTADQRAEAQSRADSWKQTTAAAEE